MPRSAQTARRATAHSNSSLPRRPDAALFPGYHLVGAPTASASSAQPGIKSAIWPVKLETSCKGLVFGFGPSWRHEHLYDNIDNETYVTAWLMVREGSGLFTRYPLTFNGQAQGTIPAVIDGAPKVATTTTVSDPLSQTFTSSTEMYLAVTAKPPFGTYALLSSAASSGSSQLIMDRLPDISSGTVRVDESTTEVVTFSSVTDNLNGTWTLNLTAPLSSSHALGRRVWQNAQVTRSALLSRGERVFDQIDILDAVKTLTANGSTDIWTLSGHGLSVGQKLVFLSGATSYGLQDGQEVWVNSVIDNNSFTVSTQLHGSTFDVSGIGAGPSATAWAWPSDKLASPINNGVNDALTSSAIASGVTMVSALSINTQPGEKFNIHAQRGLQSIQGSNDEIRVNAHGWSADTPIVICKQTNLWNITSTDPQVGVRYYSRPAVVNSSTDWLRISTTSGGAAIPISGSASSSGGVIAPAESVLKFTTVSGSTTCTKLSGDPADGLSQLVNGDELLICQVSGSNVLIADQRVFVRDVSGSTFKLSYLPNGDAISMSANDTVLAICEEVLQSSSTQSATRIHLQNATRNQHTASAAITWQGEGQIGLAPTFIAAQQVSADSVGGILGVGDSLTDDKPTLGAQPRGWLDIAGERDGVSIQNVALQGQEVANFLTSDSTIPRRRLIKTARWMTEMGTNDMGGGKSFATLQTLKRQFWQQIGIDNGLKVIACIPPPRTGNITPISGTTDNWMTVENQTRFDGWEDLRVQFASWLRGMVTEWVGPTDSTLGRGIMGRCDNNSEAPSWVFDLGGALESALNSGKYRVMSGLPTVRDGIHPTDNAHAYLASLLDLTLLR